MTRLAAGAEPHEATPNVRWPKWRAAMADAVTDLDELCRLIDLPAPGPAARQAVGSLSLRVPRSYLGRIRSGDSRDPLLLQVLPQKEELRDVPQFTTDPVGEQQGGGCRGLLWKYPSRALMVTNRTCGVHCRFCFRRHFPYQGHRGPGSDSNNPLSRRMESWEPAIEQIAAESSIHEVILSGGDPLALDDQALTALVTQLAEIPHLRRLRIHTRMPIVIPDRVTGELIDWLRGSRLVPVVVLHVNHAQEIDGEVAEAMARFTDAGVPLLAQTVLLRGVNDGADTLADLFERLVDHRVMPYYLHQLDRVSGAAHFEVPEQAGRQLMAELRSRLPGYAVPRYVREVCGESSKRPLA